MSGRVLAVVAPGEEAAALDGLTGLLTIARAADAEVRLAYVRDLPPPRVDALDHVVADTDAEMARITASVAQTFDAAARRHGDVKVETVVRFGSPAREAAVEAEVYAPQIIVVYAAATGLVARLRGWALRQQLLRRPDARLLVLDAAPAREIRRPRVGVRPPGLLPAHRD